jgi:hypothetical protein
MCSSSRTTFLALVDESMKIMQEGVRLIFVSCSVLLSYWLVDVNIHRLAITSFAREQRQTLEGDDLRFGFYFDDCLLKEKKGLVFRSPRENSRSAD